MKRFSLFVLILLGMAAIARAELTPDQIALIAMAESPESQELAKHYAKARGIPEANILLLEGKPIRTISRHLWETKTRPAIRTWLEEGERKDKIRCCVTCWDVPLKIGKRDANSPEIVERQEYLTMRRETLVKHIDQIVASLESIGSDEPAKPANPMAKDVSFDDIRKRIDSAMTTARSQLMALPDREKRQVAARRLEGALGAFGGRSQMLRMAAQAGQKLPPQQARRLEVIAAQTQGLQQGLGALMSLPPSVPRDQQILHLMPMTGGLLGSLAFVDKELESLRKNETYSSFDSELSLIQYRFYQLDRWQRNLRYYALGLGDRAGASVMMVARLAAPTLEQAKGLVDKAIAAEKKGLAGKVYIDARGIAYDKEKAKAGSYEAYDQSLRDLADRLKKHTKLEVVLNDKPELFQKGECPDAALYCGWYSLAKYVDAFDWVPGAIGYHLASSEATTLRKPGATAWCNAMLEDGITATLGPVYEPYLYSFPKPDEFFSLLLTGEYTLAEVYYRTKPFNSWVMVLVGDPLYNPFKKNPALKKEDLPKTLQPEEEKPPVAKTP
jgi:uncharacterized protein (TIGR03790 family)